MAEEEMLDFEPADGQPAQDGADVQPQAAAGGGGDAAAPAGEANGAQQKQQPAPAADPSDPLSQPPHGTEVYIANVPMEATDAQLKTFVSKAGEVYQLRLPKNPDGRNRGYGFVVYLTREAAEHAVQSLGGQELPECPGRKVNVRLNESQSKNKLYFGNLPRSYTQLQLEEELKAHTKGLESVDLMMDRENPTVNRGFAFVTFYNYACADAARKTYTETDHTSIGGRPVHVTWAEPKRVEDTSQVRAIFISGLPSTVNEQKMIDLFKVYGEIEKVMLPYSKEDPTKYREYGFVHFRERSGAVDAVEKCGQTKPELDGKELQVALAKPQPLDHGPGAGPARGPPGRGGYGGGDRYGPSRGRGGYGAPRGGGYGGGYGGGGRGYSRHDDYYEDDDYEGGGGGYGSGGGGGYGYSAPAAASTGATVMVPVQLPSGQVGYMVVPASAGGPMRRPAAAAGYGSAAYGATRGGGTGYGSGGGGYRPY